MGRVKVNLTLDANVTNEARELGLNMSRLAERAIAEAARIERNRVWREENKDAIKVYEQEIEKNGLPLKKHRIF